MATMAAIWRTLTLRHDSTATERPRKAAKRTRRIFAAWTSIFSAAEDTDAPRAAAAPSHQLRALPNEEIYFYVKRIDNASVVRANDPRAGASCWKTIGGACTAVVFVIGLLFPAAYNLLAGYQLHALQVEHQRLLDERAHLEADEARLLSPERLTELARQQHFIDPPPDKLFYLNPESKGDVALKVEGK